MFCSLALHLSFVYPWICKKFLSPEFFQKLQTHFKFVLEKESSLADFNLANKQKARVILLNVTVVNKFTVPPLHLTPNRSIQDTVPLVKTNNQTH